MAYSEKAKLQAAKDLENARQQVRLLGSTATRTDIKRVENAQKHFDKVMSKA